MTKVAGESPGDPPSESPRRYNVIFERAAQRQFNRLPRQVQAQLQPVIDALGDNPRPAGIVALQGQHGYYRLRSGDYRVVYTVRDAELLVLVVRAQHRRDVYR